jgi:hypothetical protein
MKVQEELELNGTHQQLLYADDAYILGENTSAIKKNTEALIASKPLENVAKFKYFGMTITDQNCIQEEVKSRLNMGNTCYHSVLNLLSSRLLSRNLTIKIRKNYNFIFCFVWCETYSSTPKEVHRLRVFVNRVLRKIFGPKSEEVVGGWRRLHNEELHNYTSPSIIRVM